MTCREKLKKEYPENLDEWYRGGCLGCPYHYGYLPELAPLECEKMDCKDCWDREIPGTEKTDIKNLYNWEEIHKLIENAMEKRDRSVSLSFIPGMGAAISVYPWPDTEELYDMYKKGRITANDFREKIGLPKV